MPYSEAIERFRTMQKHYYEDVRPEDDVDLQRIVGVFQEHEKFPYEKYILEHLHPTGLVALDFACGAGRMIRRLSRFFNRIDGVDISSSMIEGAKRWTSGLGSRLYVNDGVVLNDVPSGEYDLVYSTISFHHVCRYDIRMSLLREFHRVLKPNGRIAIHFFFTNQPRNEWLHHADWRESPDNVLLTNGKHDVRITPDNLKLVQEDLEQLGFVDFSYTLAPVPPPPHPAECTTNWVFIHARKP